MQTLDHYVVEVMPDRETARRAVHEIVDLGLADESLGDKVDGPAHHVVDFDADSTFGRSVATGILVGIPVGAVLVLGLVALAAAVIGEPLDRGALGGLGAGALLGVLFGGVAGVAMSNGSTETAELIDEIPVSGDEVIVAIQGNGHTSLVREMLEAAGGRPATPQANLGP